MCFVSKKIQPLVATTDIECYKMVTKVQEESGNTWYEPPVMGDVLRYRPKRKRMPKVKIKPVHDNAVDIVIIDKGYHSYMASKLIYLLRVHHHYTGTTAMGLFVIPKGTKYYIDPSNEEYVSETIRMIKEILWKN